MAAAASVMMVGLAPTRAAQSDTTAMLAGIDAKASAYAEVARQIWGFAEVDRLPSDPQ